MYNTPIELLTDKPNKIFIKREDLLPLCFGGNKYRIAYEYLEDMRCLGKNCMIAYGNPRSNLCRVLSYLCCSSKIPCYIISPDDGDGRRVDSFNQNLARLSEAIIIPCNKNNVSSSVNSVINHCKDLGLNPYYIYGDIYGKGNEKVPVEAYYKVYKNELHDFVVNESIDIIFLPVGTGMTIAGIAIASILSGYNGSVVGISIGREKIRAMESFSLYCNSYIEGLDLSNITIVDDYLMGGYGKYSDELKNMIINLYTRYGIAMDPTYVGKAFYGMSDWLKKNDVTDAKVLFIHTGGLPLWFDFINSLREK